MSRKERDDSSKRPRSIRSTSSSSVAIAFDSNKLTVLSTALLICCLSGVASFLPNASSASTNTLPSGYPKPAEQPAPSIKTLGRFSILECYCFVSLAQDPGSSKFGWPFPGCGSPDFSNFLQIPLAVELGDLAVKAFLGVFDGVGADVQFVG